VYLTGYAVRIPCINTLAKSDERNVTYRYFVEEQLVAMAALIAIPGAIALFGSGDMAMQLRRGYTSFFATPTVWPALLIGALYACLCYFGTRIYLDRRENTFCIPLNRCSSLLSAIVASYVLTLVVAERPPGTGELSAAVLVVIAILLLSPLHHFRRQFSRIERLLAESQLVYLGAVTWNVGMERIDSLLVEAAVKKEEVPARRESDSIYIESLRRVFLFVCGGNTARSPMAQAICNQEIARRLNISIEESSHNVRAISAGLAAKTGSPMKHQAQLALKRLQVSSGTHSSQFLTPDIVEQAERIFCMTQDQRQVVIGDFLAPPDKVLLLDPHGDIDEPSEADSDAFLNCAKRIGTLVSRRLDELGITGPMLITNATGD
jgi:protein-tyrosine-phosphatase